MIADNFVLFFYFLLLMGQFAIAWVPQQQQHGRSSHLLALPRSSVRESTRLEAFHIQGTKRNFGPRTTNDNNKRKRRDANDGWIPYDWENDKLDVRQDDADEDWPWTLDHVDDDPPFGQQQMAANDQNKDRQSNDNWHHELLDPFQDRTTIQGHSTIKSRRSLRWNPFAKRVKDQQQGAVVVAPPRPPLTSRARLSTTDAGTLIVDLPPSGIDSSAISSGVFGTLWLSAIAPATLAGGVVTAAILLPFWLAGGVIVKKAIVDPFCTSQLTIGQYAWSLTSNYGNAKMIRQVEGATDDLRGATVEDLHLEVNDEPLYEMKLHVNGGARGGDAHGFGNGLDIEELDYLAYVINNHLEDQRKHDVL